MEQLKDKGGEDKHSIDPAPYPENVAWGTSSGKRDMTPLSVRASKPSSAAAEEADAVDRSTWKSPMGENRHGTIESYS